MTALPCQIAQAAKFNTQTVCPNNPTGTARPWRAWVRTSYFSGSFEFETREAAVAYLADQIKRKPIDTRDGLRNRREDVVDYRGTFLQEIGGDAFSLGDLGLVPLYTVELPPAAKPTKRAIRGRTEAANEELALILNTKESNVIAHPNRGRKLASVSGNAPFVVTTDVTGVVHWLRSTTWTSARERASVFDDVESAKAAIERARQFNPKAARVAKIVGEV
jgi:hypothetical protein